MTQVILTERPRRNRKNEAIRRLVRETQLHPDHLVLPLFVQEGETEAVTSMPGVFRFSREHLVEEAKEVFKMGIPAIALFPALEEKLKDPFAKESANSKGLLQTTIQEIKQRVPDLCIISDVAMDPYSTDGHDGLVKADEVVNDETLEILAKMAISQAQAGADFVAPSDMMDGRVGFIRRALDEEGFSNVGILSYTAKYASHFYGPFRDALQSAPKKGDKKTYQMDFSNSIEALREARLDIQEGADIIMVKPALPYLDILSQLKSKVDVPIAAYQVSGEYTMIQLAAKSGICDLEKMALETLTAIRRAGADLIFSYFAKNIVRTLN